MKRDLIKSIYADQAAFDGKEIVVGSWARSIRDSKAFGFIDLYDGSCFKTMQVVFERDKIANYDEIAKLNGASAPYKKIGHVKLRTEEFPKNTLRKIMRFKLDMSID